jgi:hypothetical protein
MKYIELLNGFLSSAFELMFENSKYEAEPVESPSEIEFIGREGTSIEMGIDLSR